MGGDNTFSPPSADMVSGKKELLYEATQTYLHFYLNKDKHPVSKEELALLLASATKAMTDLRAAHKPSRIRWAHRLMHHNFK